MLSKKFTSGFTIVELLVVIVIIGVLSTLVITTYSGVQTKNRNTQRQADIDSLQGQLETYFVQYSQYPTLANMNTSSWRSANLKNVSDSSIQDPSWSKKVTACTDKNNAVLNAKPIKGCYTYLVTSSDGTACDNAKTPCTQYVLTAILEGGNKYVKASLN